MKGTFVAFCRKENSSRSEWAWRSGFIDPPFSTELYDRVEDFLAMWMHFRGQTKDNTEPNLFPLL